MNEENMKHNHGFSLIELLMVLGMLGVVMTAVYSLYQVQQKTVTAQDEVVEVQQNLRIAMDEISRDIKMSGFLLPSDPACPSNTLTPILTGSVVNNGGLGGTDAVTLNIASASGQYARIDQDVTSGASTVFVVDSAESVDKFRTNDTVRIIRVQDMTEPPPGGALPGGLMLITGLTRTPPSNTITIATPVGVSYKKYDVIAGTTSLVRPDTIRYCVASSAAAGACPASAAGCPSNQRCIMKIVNGNSNLIATNIIDLQFAYLLKDNTEVANPPDLRQIRAVRVTITGQTVATNNATGEVRQRQMMSIVKMRNDAQTCL